jgi:hypothetical protein
MNAFYLDFRVSVRTLSDFTPPTLAVRLFSIEQLTCEMPEE